MLQHVFAGKRVLVTGHTGFKGSWLGLWLCRLGADVLGYALPPERDEDHFNLLGLKAMLRHVEGDIRDLSGLRRVFNEFQPEILFHLAAQSLVRRSYTHPKLTFDTNVGGSVNVLEAVRLTPSVRTVIYVTSDKCYRNREWVWGYRENDELGGSDPYSASKAAAELVFSAYLKSFFGRRKGFGAASVRAGNAIGGGDWAPNRIVPDSIRSLRRSRPIVLRNPSAIRPWQHVLDPLYGYLLLAASLHHMPEEYSGAWNFGPSGTPAYTVRQLAERIVTCWGGGDIHTSERPPNASPEAGWLQLNCDKAHRLLGWRPGWDFDRTVAETVRWYKDVAAGKPALAVTGRQIQSYSEERGL